MSAYKQVYKSPFGCHIVESVNGFYQRTHDHEWNHALAVFRELQKDHVSLLTRLLTRATKRSEYELYHRVKKAVQRRNPQPMPWNHIMFNGCKMPQEKD